MNPAARTTRQPGALARLLQRAVDVRPAEVQAVLVSAAYFFFLLCSYYVIRPIRDEMGVLGGVENLAWLFTGTLVAMLLMHPLYTGLVGRMPRRRFIPITYRFFALNLVAFFLLLRWLPEGQGVWAGRAFFIWASVFNLFVVSVFWSFMADLFASEQGKRLFAFIGVGGTIGAMSGAAITAGLARLLSPVNLLLVSALLLELAVWCVVWLGRNAPDAPEPVREGEEAPEPAGATTPAFRKPDERRDEGVGGSVWEGVGHVLRSPYLLGICAFMLLYTIGSTFLYFARADILARATEDSGLRTALFALEDLLTNGLTLLLQVFLTARLIRWLGMAAALAILPTLSILGFLGLSMAPAVAVVIGFGVLRRGVNYGLARPAREVLFTVIPRADKYKAKNFIDTFVYRVGDQVGAWSYTLLAALGLTLGALALTAVPVSAVWLGVAIWLGREQRKRESPAAPREPDLVSA